MPERPIAAYYEHPEWFDALFAELDRRQVPYADGFLQAAFVEVVPARNAGTGIFGEA